MDVMIATWAAFIIAGIAGLGLGMGLVIGSAIVRGLRDDGQHRR